MQLHHWFFDKLHGCLNDSSRSMTFDVIVFSLHISLDIDKHQIIVETDLPDYFLNIAQKRAAAYYQRKFKLTPEAHTAQQFKNPGTERKFQPENDLVQKEIVGLR